MIAAGAIPAADIRVGSQQALAVYAGEELVWEAVPTVAGYLTFSSPAAFTLAVNNATKNWDGTLEYSTDTESWSTWDGTTTLTAAANGGSYYLYLRGSGNTTIMGGQMGVATKYWVLSGTNILCDGDIRTLLDYSDPEYTVMSDYCFAYLFYNCASLVSAPRFPSTTLAPYCYKSTFYGCTSLSAAPELPATTLAGYCYDSMFHGCTSLSAAPELPATTLAGYCYSFMFKGCVSITTIPELPATTLATSCYSFMFQGCVSITTIPELPATALMTGCYAYMFHSCAGIKLSETKEGAYQTPYRIPSSGTGVDATNALILMFNNTGGTFTGTPTINTTYYTSNTVI